MPTVTSPIQKSSRVLEELENLPEVGYPQEVMEWLDKEFEAAEAQIAAGELKPQTAAELAAELGIKFG